MSKVIRNPSEEFSKRLKLLLNRIDNLITNKKLAKVGLVRNWDTVLEKIRTGEYIIDKTGLRRQSAGGYLGYNLKYRGVDWETFISDIKDIFCKVTECTELPLAILDDIEIEQEREDVGLQSRLVTEKLKSLKENNKMPIVQGKWRREPYPERSYIPLESYVAADSLSITEANEVLLQLDTTLKTSFVGPAMNCMDQEDTEKWMRKFISRDKKVKSTEDEIVLWQVQNCMNHLLNTVQDRVLTDTGVLDAEPIDLGWQLKETSVWGIDCFTRKMLELILTDNCDARSDPVVKDVADAQDFVEYTLLPCINLQVGSRAHNMSNALTYIIQVTAAYTNVYHIIFYLYSCLMKFILYRTIVFLKNKRTVLLLFYLPNHCLVTIYSKYTQREPG